MEDHCFLSGDQYIDLSTIDTVLTIIDERRYILLIIILNLFLTKLLYHLSRITESSQTLTENLLYTYKFAVVGLFFFLCTAARV